MCGWSTVLFRHISRNLLYSENHIVSSTAAYFFFAGLFEQEPGSLMKLAC